MFLLHLCSCLAHILFLLPALSFILPYRCFPCIVLDVSSLTQIYSTHIKLRFCVFSSVTRRMAMSFCWLLHRFAPDFQNPQGMNRVDLEDLLSFVLMLFNCGFDFNVLTTIGCICVTFGAQINVLKMNFDDFSDLLCFHLAPWSGRNCTLNYDQTPAIEMATQSFSAVLEC